MRDTRHYMKSKRNEMIVDALAFAAMYAAFTGALMIVALAITLL